MSDLVELSSVSTAIELLDSLSPRNSAWGKVPTEWVFRGHASTDWILRATAHRPGAYDKIPLPPRLKPSASDDWSQRDDQNKWLLHRFLEVMDESGLELPRDLPRRDHVPVITLGSDPDPSLWPLMALAQHHGLPTPLLDWSRSSRVAAYFAAKEALEKRGESTRLAIWALRESALPTKEPLDCGNGAQVRKLLAPRASNANLHAQAGVFTWTSGGSTEVPGLDACLQALQINRPDAIARQGSGLPLLRKFELPREEAGHLLELLSQEGVSAGSLFPGVAGAAAALRERVYFRSYMRGVEN